MAAAARVAAQVRLSRSWEGVCSSTLDIYLHHLPLDSDTDLGLTNSFSSFPSLQYGKAVGGAGTPTKTEPGEEARFHHDIDINDVRNRYLLTKGATQDEVGLTASGSSQLLRGLIHLSHTDQIRDGSHGYYKRYLASRQIKSNRERPCSVPSYHRTHAGDSQRWSGRCRETSQYRPWPARDRFQSATAR